MNAAQAQAKISPSVSEGEVARFSSRSGEWWDEGGAFAALHRINRLRLEYITARVAAHYGNDGRLRGLRVLDVGCGGGLLSEPLARQGAKVTAIDASEAAIEAAKEHAASSGLKIDYRAITAEKLAHDEASGFDVVTAMEIVEHVADLRSLVSALSRLLRPDGLLVMSTLNRTMRSYMQGIVAAEYILGWVPAGTHEWRKFVRPSELARVLEGSGLLVEDLAGMPYNPFAGEFELSSHDLRVNYLLSARKGI